MLQWSNRRQSAKFAKNAQKVPFWGSRRRHKAKMETNFWKNLFQSDLPSSVNNLNHGFIGQFRCHSGPIGENLQKTAQNAQKVHLLGPR
jgi:hypothetical protein